MLAQPEAFHIPQLRDRQSGFSPSTEELDDPFAFPPPARFCGAFLCLFSARPRPAPQSWRLLLFVPLLRWLMHRRCGSRPLRPWLSKGVCSISVVTKKIVFCGAAALLLAGSAMSALPDVHAGEVLVSGNHSNHSNQNKSKSHKNNGNKKSDKTKGNNGVRDHGKGEGRDNSGQGKGQGHKNKK